jgi:hypothetical protein
VGYRFTQRIQPGRHCQLRRDIQCFDQLLGHAIFLVKIETAGSSGEFDHLVRISDNLKVAAAVCALHQPGDLFLQHQLAESFWNEIDELLAAQNPQSVVRSSRLSPRPASPILFR